MRTTSLLAAVALVLSAGVSHARFVLQPAAWNTLPEWETESFEQVSVTFARICERWKTLPPTLPLARTGTAIRAGTLADWRPACDALPPLTVTDTAALRAYWQTWFNPWKVVSDERPLFTGYYEIALEGSETPSEIYRYPVHGRPADLVQQGEQWGRKGPGGALIPYPSRKDIDGGALQGQAPVLFWLKDKIDLFFLHVQGSGTIALPDGRLERVGFAARNGQPYTAIGQVLIERGALNHENTNLQTIRAWLRENPADADEVMHQNASYIFFQKRDTLGPIGAMSVPLTARRSMAVDPAIIPYGAPMWLEVDWSQKFPRTFKTMVFAMDTGAAIRGAVRGDFFWGTGLEAEEAAGRMANPGRYTIFLPKTIQP